MDSKKLKIINNNMISKIDAFLKFPDWKKIELKKQGKYKRFPMINIEQKIKREQFTFDIFFHFGQIINLPEVQEEFVSMIPFLNNIEDYWPKSITKYLTHRLIDFIDSNLFTDLGYCYLCDNWEGHNTVSYKRMDKLLKHKMVQLYGICTHPTINESFVSPINTCVFWKAKPFIDQVIKYKIQNILVHTDYMKDYFLDLEKINFWEYFKIY